MPTPLAIDDVLVASNCDIGVFRHLDASGAFIENISILPFPGTIDDYIQAVSFAWFGSHLLVGVCDFGYPGTGGIIEYDENLDRVRNVIVNPGSDPEININGEFDFNAEFATIIATDPDYFIYAFDWGFDYRYGPAWKFDDAGVYQNLPIGFNARDQSINNFFRAKSGELASGTSKANVNNGLPAWPTDSGIAVLTRWSTVDGTRFLPDITIRTSQYGADTPNCQAREPCFLPDGSGYLICNDFYEYSFPDYYSKNYLYHFDASWNFTLLGELQVPGNGIEMQNVLIGNCRLTSDGSKMWIYDYTNEGTVPDPGGGGRYDVLLIRDCIYQIDIATQQVSIDNIIINEPVAPYGNHCGILDIIVYLGGDPPPPPPPPPPCPLLPIECGDVLVAGIDQDINVVQVEQWRAGVKKGVWHAGVDWTNEVSFSMAMDSHHNFYLTTAGNTYQLIRGSADGCHLPTVDLGDTDFPISLSIDNADRLYLLCWSPTGGAHLVVKRMTTSGVVLGSWTVHSGSDSGNYLSGVINGAGTRFVYVLRKDPAEIHEFDLTTSTDQIIYSAPQATFYPVGVRYSADDPDRIMITLALTGGPTYMEIDRLGTVIRSSGAGSFGDEINLAYADPTKAVLFDGDPGSAIQLDRAAGTYTTLFTAANLAGNDWLFPGLVACAVPSGAMALGERIWMASLW